MEETVTLAGTAAAMPRVGLGVYQLRGEDCARACLAALEAGYRHIDTAQLYGNEADVGRALQEWLGRTGAGRGEHFLTTKIGRCEGSAEKTYRSALRSVQRVAGEGGYVDLFLVHRPVERRREIWAALERLVDEGRVRAVGVSNFRAGELEEMRAYARVWPPSVNQIEVHPWCQQRELVGHCQRSGIVVQAYSPLARGRRMADPVLRSVVERVRRRVRRRHRDAGGPTDGAGRAGGPRGAEEAGEEVKAVTAAQVLVRWSLQKGLVPLPKSSSAARIKENADVFWFELDGDEMGMLDGLDMGAEGALFPANVS